MKYNHESIPDQGVTYPDGPYKVKITGQEDGEGRNGQAVIKVSSRILAPAKFRNQPFGFAFSVGVTASTAAKLGIEEDLAAENEETWAANPSCRRYKAFVKKCGVEPSDDTEEDAENVRDKVIVIDVGSHQDDNGRTYNDANAFYSEEDAAGRFGFDFGEAKPSAKPANGLDKSRTALKPRQGAPAAPKPTRTAKPAQEPEQAGDDWE